MTTSLSHYGENWSAEDKRLFDELVKEEMEKVERDFQRKASIGSKFQSYDDNISESPAERENIYSGSLNAHGRNLPRDLSGRGKLQNQDELNNRVSSNGYQAPATNFKQELTPSQQEQSFTEKMGQYESLNKDQRKLRQKEYAQQLNQQMAAIQSSTDNRANITRSRRNTEEVNYNSGSQFSIGADPMALKQQEKQKKLEYARQLNQQVDYQRAMNSSRENEDFIGRSRGYSDPKSISKGFTARDASPITPSNYRVEGIVERSGSGRMTQPSRAPYAEQAMTGFQIGQDAANEKRKRKEKQAEYYRQLSGDKPLPSDDSYNRVPERQYRPSEDLPGGGFLNIGENQSTRYPSRNSRIVEDQEGLQKKRAAQQEYQRLLEQDKAAIDITRAPDLSYGRSPSRNMSTNEPTGTGLAIGRDGSSKNDRRQRQQEYRDALSQDVANRPYDPLNDKSRQSSVRSVEEPMSYNGRQDDRYSQYPRGSRMEDVTPTGSAGNRSGSGRMDPYSDRQMGSLPLHRSGMDIERGITMTDSRKYGSSAPWDRGQEPNVYAPRERSNSNFRTRGASTGGGASSITLG